MAAAAILKIEEDANFFVYCVILAFKKSKLIETMTTNSFLASDLLSK